MMEGTQPFNSATDNFGHDCPFATRENISFDEWLARMRLAAAHFAPSPMLHFLRYNSNPSLAASDAGRRQPNSFSGSTWKSHQHT